MDGGSKYAPLANRLSAIGDPVIEMTFAEVDKLLPGGLPESAFRYRTWWTSRAGNSAQSRYGWICAGYQVSRVDLGGQRVWFIKVKAGTVAGPVAGPAGGHGTVSGRAD